MRPDIAIGRPHLFGDEQRVLDEALSAARCYLEFGAGGSTLLAATQGVPRVVSVDSDPQWVAAVLAHPEIAARVQDGSMSVLHADIGPVGNWGHPADETLKHRWPTYLATAWAECQRRSMMPDLVLVDGRFRVASCLSVVLAVGLAALAGPTVLLHDVFADRPHYLEVLNFFEVVGITGSLYRLRIRPDASPRAALLRLLECQFDPR